MRDRSIYEPSTWPVVWRRAFLLTLPISGPIYVLGFAVAIFLSMVVFILAVVIVGPVEWASRLWNGDAT